MLVASRRLVGMIICALALGVVGDVALTRAAEAQVWRRRTRESRVAPAAVRPPAKAKAAKKGNGRRPVRAKKRGQVSPSLIIEESGDSDDPRAGRKKSR